MLPANTLVQSRYGVWVVGVHGLPSRGHFGMGKKALCVDGFGETGQPPEFRAAAVARGEERPEAGTGAERRDSMFGTGGNVRCWEELGSHY